MADASVFDLTQETVMTAAARIPLQETSGATRATSATYALMGGLSYDATYDTNANHADNTFAAADMGKLFGVDMSGASLASEVIFKLPLEANVNVGERIGFYITAGSTTNGEELAIRTGATGDTITGVDYSAADWSRLFITGEVVIFRCINKTTQADWIIETDGRIACVAHMIGSTALSTNTASVWTPIVLDGSTTMNTGNCTNLTSGKMVPRRSGNWSVGGSSVPNASITSSESWGIGVSSNDGTTRDTFIYNQIPITYQYWYWSTRMVVIAVTTATSIVLQMKSSESNKGAVGTSSNMSMMEILP